VPSDCTEPDATCVAWTCRNGAERTAVAVLQRVAVIPALVASNRPEVRQATQTLVRHLRADLARAGFYEVLSEDRFPAGWERDGASLAEIRRHGWLAAGVSRLVQVIVGDGTDAASLMLRVVDLERWGPEAVTTERRDLPLARQGELRELSAAWVNALIGRDTGLAGGIGQRLIGSSETAPGVKEVVTVRDDGSDWRQITKNGSLNLNAAWAPGGRPAWMSYVSGNTDWWLDHQPFSTRPGLNSAGAWSPDGRYLALAVSDRGDSQIILVDGRTGQEHARLTDTVAIATSPTWSPDGRRIAFVSDRVGGVPQIFAVDLATGTTEQLTRDGYNTNPDWSPAGDVIAFQRQFGAVFGLMRLDLTTGQIRRIGPQRGSAESPAFSPDGRWIAFSVVDRRSARLWLMTADGERAAPLGGETTERSFIAPAWEHPPRAEPAR
jgi:TolB protein